MLMVAGRLSVIASRLSGLYLSNHGLAPVANDFQAFGTVWPGCDGAGFTLRKSFTALPGGATDFACGKRGKPRCRPIRVAGRCERFLMLRNR